MTNEELAELERRIVAGYEGGEKTDDGSQSWGLGFEAGVRTALIATAREAEALRAENARLTKAVEAVDPAQLHPVAAKLFRAALEQGEVK